MLLKVLNMKFMLEKNATDVNDERWSGVSTGGTCNCGSTGGTRAATLSGRGEGRVSSVNDFSLILFYQPIPQAARNGTVMD